MRIGELAAEAGVNLQTIRLYERRGLLREPPRLMSGYRTYSVEAAGAGFEKVRGEAVVRENETANVPLTMKITTVAELTVTATLREELLSDVPFSVAAPTEEVLAARGVGYVIRGAITTGSPFAASASMVIRKSGSQSIPSSCTMMRSFGCRSSTPPKMSEFNDRCTSCTILP